MKIKGTIKVLSIAIVLIASSCTGAKDTSQSRGFKDVFSGTFDSDKKEKGKTRGAAAVAVSQLHFTPIPKPGVSEGDWFYLEKVKPLEEEPVVLQKVYEITQNRKWKYTMNLYDICNANEFEGEWSNPDAFEQLDKRKLIEHRGCEIVMKKSTKGNWYGEVDIDKCASWQSGIKSVTVTEDEFLLGTFRTDEVEKFPRTPAKKSNAFTTE